MLHKIWVCIIVFSIHDTPSKRFFPDQSLSVSTKWSLWFRRVSRTGAMKNYALDKRDLCAALRKAITRQGAVKVETLHSHVAVWWKARCRCVNTHLPCIFTGGKEKRGPHFKYYLFRCTIHSVLEKTRKSCKYTSTLNDVIKLMNDCEKARSNVAKRNGVPMASRPIM